MLCRCWMFIDFQTQTEPKYSELRLSKQYSCDLCMLWFWKNHTLVGTCTKSKSARTSPDATEPLLHSGSAALSELVVTSSLTWRSDQEQSNILILVLVNDLLEQPLPWGWIGGWMQVEYNLHGVSYFFQWCQSICKDNLQSHFVYL
jgi:hypothetical protein